MTFDEFVEDFSANRAVENNLAAKHIYEGIICREDVRIHMVELSDAGITALSACADEIAEFCAKQQELNLMDDVVKQTIGRMVAASLKPLGYEPEKRGRVKAAKTGAFTSAKVYIPKGKAEEIVVKRIIDAE
ncbi:MAG TPA: hypothetical protein PLN48_18020 [Lachnospiraceae bacterium]|nr:hypothetical protein [Lachnospiraceae bacterium]